MATWSGEYFRNCCKDLVGWIFMVGVIMAFILLVIMNVMGILYKAHQLKC